LGKENQTAFWGDRAKIGFDERLGGGKRKEGLKKGETKGHQKGQEFRPMASSSGKEKPMKGGNEAKRGIGGNVSFHDAPR